MNYFSISLTIHSFDENQESVVEVEAGWKDIALQIGELGSNVAVYPQDPITLVIHNSYGEDYLILDVNSLEDGQSMNICMIVAVYKIECPLHNKLGNIKVK